MKKSSQKSPNPDLSENSVSFSDIEKSVFTEVKGEYYLGREKIPEVLLSVLRDDAQKIQATRLWEVISASAANEAYRWALNESEDFELVRSAKMLQHWIVFANKMINKLAKKG